MTPIARPPFRRYSLPGLTMVLSLLVPVALFAQSAPTADAVALAKYDINKNGSLDPDELDAFAAGQKNLVPVPVAGTDPKSDETISMSPFEVATSSNGYFAQNTMSGTRFNSKVEDLGAALSIVTKQQMSDFGMLDINDVFLYAASAEGTGSFSDITIDRGGNLIDNVQLSPNTANRIRGLSSANISYGNYELFASRYVIDPIDTESLEISRGPNANVFGLGNPSGTVNVVPTAANLTRDKTTASFRVDNLGGYRSSLDFNRVLRKNVLALRSSIAFQDEEFVRKPSGVHTLRYNAMVKFRPFKTTTISAAYKYYKMNGTRVNSSPLRDYYSSWAANGRPAWDPVAQKYTTSDGVVWGAFNATATLAGPNGQFVGPASAGGTFAITVDSALPAFLSRATNGTTPQLFVDETGAVKYWTRGLASLSTGTGPATGASLAAAPAPANTARLVNSNPAGYSNGKSITQPLFASSPVISDQSVYDWTEINLAAMNRLWDKTQIFNVQLDQEIFRTNRQSLFLQLGFLREDDQRYQNNPLNAGSGQSGQLFVDVNKSNLDGTPNPFFGRPYIGVYQPEIFSMPARWDTSRAQLSYMFDLTKENKWLSWLGSHQLNGYSEYKYRVSRTYTSKYAIASNPGWFQAAYDAAALAAPGTVTTKANQGAVTQLGGPAQASSPAAARFSTRYYVGDANGLNVDSAPRGFQLGTYDYNYGNGGTGFVNEPTTIGAVEVSDSTGGPRNTKTILRTKGGAIQSFFWGGKIVTTFGARIDQQQVKTGNVYKKVTPNGLQVDRATSDAWNNGDYRTNKGRTTTAQFVVRPLRDLDFLARTAREGGVLGFAASVAKGLSYTYNESDSFLPAAPAFDDFLDPLPNPHGKSQEKGFWLSLGDKLSVRYVQFKTQALDNRDGNVSTFAQRALRHDVAPQSSPASYLLRARATDWIKFQNPDFTPQQVADEVAKQMGLSNATMDALANNFDAGLIGVSQDAVSKGKELEVNFNPNKYWTVSASATDTRTINIGVAQPVQDFVNSRLPIWTTIVDPRITDAQAADPALANPGKLWWRARYGAALPDGSRLPNGALTVQTAEQNYQAFINAPLSLARQLDGKPNPQTKRYSAKVSSSLKLAGISDNRTLQKFTIGGSARWDDKASIGFLGLKGDPANPNVYTQLDGTRPVYYQAPMAFDSFISYRTRLFRNKIGASFQLNVRNMQESGRLQPIQADPDGAVAAYRIVDPRTFMFTVTFDL